MSQPLWVFAPDWSERVTETLSWKTDILTSPTGAEQRIARRITPRRTFEFSILVDGQVRQQLENQLVAHASAVWSFPLFTEGLILTDALTVGQVLISLQQAEIRLSGVQAIWLKNGAQSELIAFSVVTANSVTVAPLSQSWPAGTSLYPVAPALLTDMPALNRYTDRLARIPCRFRLQQANPFPVLDEMALYRDFPVLEWPSDWSEDRKSEYQRLLLELDNETGIPFRTDTARRAFWLQHHDWTVSGYQEQVKFRQLMMALRGQQRAIWVSSQTDDLTPILMTGSRLTTLFTGLSAIKPSHGRRDIQLRLVDGSSRYYRIVSVTADNDHEHLQLDGALPALSQVERISFLTLCRQNNDDISWLHHTDSVAQISTVFREVRDELE